MHPAYSVILFTTASGAGYGLLFWMALLAAFGAIPSDPLLGIIGLGLALLLITAGLLSSTFHLGHPERAWRAFSQWRTSWLSREGVAAVATYVPTGLLAIGWVFFGSTAGVLVPVALLAAFLALATVWCTGMIYQSLTTIRAWHEPLVTPIYLVLALSTGGLLTLLVLAVFGIVPSLVGWLIVGLLVASLTLKHLYWSAIDAAPRPLTPGDATGLGRIGTVRTLEPPHTSANYIMREMGYQVARKHASRLRTLVLAVGFGLPLAAVLLMLATPAAMAIPLTVLAVIAGGIGVIVERWLFFAEAQHIVTLYYGAPSA